MEEDKKIPEQEKEKGEEEEEKKEVKKKTGTTFWVIIAIAYAILFALDLYFSTKKVMIFGEEWNWGWALFFAQIVYTLLSFRQVGPKELGAKLFFGKPVQEVESGLVFVPLLLFKLEKETRLTIQEELPGAPEFIYRGDGETPKNMFPPIRIPFANISKNNVEGKKNQTKENDEKDLGDPLYRRVTAEVVPIIRWRINNYILFLTTIGSRDEAKKQMEDATIAFCMRELTKIPVAEALVTLQDFNEVLQRIIENLVHDWGIKVKTAQIKLINFHHDLNQAISSVPEAEFAAKAKVKTAEGEKEKLQLEGEGSGAAEKAILDGRTAGLVEMKKQLALESGIVLSAETARAITNNPGQKTVITGVKGFADLIGIATGIEKTLKDEGGNK